MRTVGLWLFVTGIILLVSATGVSLWFRKEGVGLRRALGAGSDLAASPDKYVRDNVVPFTRTLTFTGVIMVLIAVLCLVAASLH